MINEIIADDSYKKFCYYISKGNDIHNDLYQHFIEIILTMDKEKLQDLKKRNKIRQYCLAIIYKTYNSNTSVFYKHHRTFNHNNNNEFLASTAHIEKYDHSIDLKFNQIKKQFKAAKRKEGSEEWYLTNLFEMYQELGTYDAVSKATGINLKSIAASILKFRKQIQCKIKTSY